MEVKQEQFLAEEVNDMHLQIDYADITVETAEVTQIQIVAEMDPNAEYRSSVLDGVLTVAYRYRLIRKHIYQENGVQIKILLPQGKRFSEIVLETGAGTINLERAELFGERIRIRTGAGSVKTGYVQANEMLAIEVGAGSVELKDARSKLTTVNCGAGHFAMHGVVAEELAIDCGVGKCQIDLEGNESDYDYAISCGIGEVSVNGNKINGLGGEHNKHNPNATGRICVKCGLGKVVLHIS